MFSFGRKSKVRKAVAGALARVEAEADVADHAPIEALPPDLQADAYRAVVVELHRDERYHAAQHSLGRALELAPSSVELHRLAAAVAGELGDHEASLAAQRRVVELAPRDLADVAVLADLLIGMERVDEVIELLRPLRAARDPELETRFAEALFVRGEAEEALAILDEVCELYDAQLKELSAADWQALQARAEAAHSLREDVYAELHGREATIELSAAAGKLDAAAGVNYRLLGHRLAAASARIAGVLELEPPDLTERRGSELLAGTPGSARGLALVGSAQLRRGEVSAAKKTFQRACEADGGCFAAFLGLGAALDHEKFELPRRARKLTAPPPSHAVLEAVVADLPALTELERRVVWASARPLASLLPPLAARGITIRILPIDVRATDIGLFAEIAGTRAEDDQRSYDAITGVATHEGAVVKIEDLLDIVTDGGWTFAHELAHLVFFHMSEAQVAPVLDLYERALHVGYANTEHALSHPEQFFAASYTEFLRVRHELPGAPEPDDAGIQRALFTYFSSLEVSSDQAHPYR